MNRILLAVKPLLRRVTSSIAFYPTLIAISFIALALLMIWGEYKPWIMEIKPSIAILLVGTVDDGRLVLGTLVASIISLMVFSFSMVMVVLNQASAHLSPRLLPGLITAKDNQVVLGVYLGTICYCMILILNIRSADSGIQVPELGILVGMLCGLLCLGLFMYFIHSISQSIQVDTILQRLFKQTAHRLNRESTDKTNESCEAKDWFNIKAPKAGYLKWIQEGELLSLCEKKDMKVRMERCIGHFYIEGSTYLKVSEKLDDTDIHDIHQCFVFYPEESTVDYYSFGFKQISEIAVKSMSPGINDPATAIKVIDILMVLLVQRCQTVEKYVLCDSDETPRIFLNPTQISDLLYDYIVPIKHYSKRDPLVMKRLISGMIQVYLRAEREADKTALIEHILAIREACDKNMDDQMDRDLINMEIRTFNKVSESFSILLLADLS